MTLKQLEAFYWAASAASFLVAAERLHVSQSTLSKRISELELQLGAPLFDRSGHRAVLTEAGEQLIPLARRMLGLADDMRALVAGSGGARGHCRFGVGELAALTWLPDLVAHVREEFPDVVLEPCVDLGAALEQRLESGELDFAVVAGYSSRSAIASEAIAEVRFSWAAAPALVGSRRSITASLLQETALITMPPAAGPTRMLEHWLAATTWRRPAPELQQPGRHRQPHRRRRRHRPVPQWLVEADGGQEGGRGIEEPAGVAAVAVHVSVEKG